MPETKPHKVLRIPTTVFPGWALSRTHQPTLRQQNRNYKLKYKEKRRAEKTKQSKTKQNKNPQNRPSKKNGMLSNDLTQVTELPKSKDGENRTKEIHLELTDNLVPKLIK